MKLIIAGGRKYKFTDKDIERLDELLEDYDIQEVVSGKARGADTEGENWALTRGIPVKEFPANWNLYGKNKAGVIRNREMAQYADALAIFKGGNGSADMRKQAKKYGLIIFDMVSNDPDPLEEYLDSIS